MDIIINKYIFDGNHETTKSILSLMLETDFQNKDVIDVGCGSGILTIKAHELGANHIVALDFDSRARDNTKQNLDRNGITNADVYWIDFIQTDLHADIILANLPRENIVMCLPKIKESLNDDGIAIISRYKEVPEDSLLKGWHIINHIEGIEYDAYVLRKVIQND